MDNLMQREHTCAIYTEDETAIKQVELSVAGIRDKSNNGKSCVLCKNF